MPGRQKVFDIYGGPSVKLSDVSRQAHGWKNHAGRVRELKSLEVGVQKSCGVYTEVPKERAVRGVDAAFGGGVSQAG